MKLPFSGPWAEARGSGVQHSRTPGARTTCIGGPQDGGFPFGCEGGVVRSWPLQCEGSSEAFGMGMFSSVHFGEEVPIYSPII